MCWWVTTPSLVSTPQRLEVVAGLVVLACVGISCATFATAAARWRANRRSPEPGPLLFAWMQLRTEALVLGAQSVALVMTLYRFYHPDVWASCGRAAVAVLLALALHCNRRDFRRL